MSRRSDEWARRSEDGEESSRSERRRHGFGSAILGLGVLALGAVMLLDNFGVVDGEELFDYWPVFLVLIGISHLVRPAVRPPLPSLQCVSGATTRATFAARSRRD